jgi:hypothetical protein
MTFHIFLFYRRHAIISSSHTINNNNNNVVEESLSHFCLIAMRMGKYNLQLAMCVREKGDRFEREPTKKSSLPKTSTFTDFYVSEMCFSPTHHQHKKGKK